MPNLNMGKIDTGKLPRNVHEQYEHMLYLSQRKYWWIMFFVGSGMFLFSGWV